MGGRNAVHTWQATTANGNFRTKGVVYAAKVLGGTAYALLDDPSHVERANKKFDEVTGKRSYETPLSPETEPPFDITGE